MSRVSVPRLVRPRRLTAVLALAAVLPLAACSVASVSGGGPEAASAVFERGDTLTFVNPSDAGTSSDVGFRDLMRHAEDGLGVNIETINRAGSGTQLGLNELSSARPDGLTIGSTALPTTVGVYLDPQRQASFDRASFVPIMQHVFDPGATAVRADSPYRSIDDLVAAALAAPGEISIAAGGRNSRQHLDVLSLQERTGAQFRIVHADSSANPLTLLLSGDVAAVHESVGDLWAPAQGGEVAVLGVWDEQRSEFAPDVATMQEQGVDLVSGSRRVISAPAGTPPERVQALADALIAAAANPEHVELLASSGLQVRPLGPEEIAAVWEDTEQRYGALVQSTG